MRLFPALTAALERLLAGPRSEPRLGRTPPAQPQGYPLGLGPGCYRLLALQGVRLTRETLLMMLGAARHQAPKPGEDTEEHGQGD